VLSVITGWNECKICEQAVALHASSWLLTGQLSSMHHVYMCDERLHACCLVYIIIMQGTCKAELSKH
jgi:hypothetical protein